VSDNKDPRTTVYTSIVILGLVVLVMALVARSRFHEDRTEMDVIWEEAARSNAPVVVAAEASFEQSDFNPALHANLQQVVRSFQAPIEGCAKKWNGHPSSVLIRLETDGAGRLVSLAVKGAPEPAESCFKQVLSRGQFARKISGVVQLNLDFNR
jgi:hypothetical protein